MELISAEKEIKKSFENSNWTEEELKYLFIGVELYGRENTKKILERFREHFKKSRDRNSLTTQYNHLFYYKKKEIFLNYQNQAKEFIKENNLTNEGKIKNQIEKQF